MQRRWIWIGLGLTGLGIGQTLGFRLRATSDDTTAHTAVLLGLLGLLGAAGAAMLAAPSFRRLLEQSSSHAPASPPPVPRR